MVNQFGDQYREYMARTGMFLPRGMEAFGRRFFPEVAGARTEARFRVSRRRRRRRRVRPARSTPWTGCRSGRTDAVTALAILPDDRAMLEHRMANVLELPEVKARLAQRPGPVLVYVVPQEYVMQGMIADTGPEWRLYEHHQTLAMIADWIFHPFRHLQGGHAMHAALGIQAAGAPSGGVFRRLIFLSVATPREAATPAALFAINTARIPRFLADVDVHGLVLLEMKDLGPGTGWGDVPTPLF